MIWCLIVERFHQDSLLLGDHDHGFHHFNPASTESLFQTKKIKEEFLKGLKILLMV